MILTCPFAPGQLAAALLSDSMTQMQLLAGSVALTADHLYSTTILPRHQLRTFFNIRSSFRDSRGKKKASHGGEGSSFWRVFQQTQRKTVDQLVSLLEKGPPPDKENTFAESGCWTLGEVVSAGCYLGALSSHDPS